MSDPILEVIVCSVADAIEANEGGASRLEVVRDLDKGGLTPSVEVVSAIQEAVDLSLRVMVRESVGYQARNEMEVQSLAKAAEQFAKMNVDGVVLGFLAGDHVDVELTSRVLAGSTIRATFHHAFEAAKHQLEALGDIKRIPQVDRILSHGGNGDLQQRIEKLAAYADVAGPELTILAGGGIDCEAISLLRRTTQIREFHVGRAARSGFSVEGGVEAKLVRKLVQVARES